MTAAAPSGADTTLAEEWRYAGYRHPEGGKPYSAWQDSTGRMLGYGPKGDARRTPGAVYQVRVDRGNGKMTRHGEPKFLRMQHDDQACAWAAEEQAALQRKARVALERKARPPLDEAIRPLMRIAAGLRTRAEQDALAAYVIGQLRRAQGFHPDEFLSAEEMR